MDAQGILGGILQGVGQFGVNVANEDMREARNLKEMMKRQEFADEFARLQHSLGMARDNAQADRADQRQKDDQTWRSGEAKAGREHDVTMQDGRFKQSKELASVEHGYGLARIGAQGAESRRNAQFAKGLDDGAGDPIKNMQGMIASAQYIVATGGSLDPATGKAYHYQDTKDPKTGVVTMSAAEQKLRTLSNASALLERYGKLTSKQSPDDLAKGAAWAQSGGDAKKYFETIKSGGGLLAVPYGPNGG